MVPLVWRSWGWGCGGWVYPSNSRTTTTLNLPYPDSKQTLRDVLYLGSDPRLHKWGNGESETWEEKSQRGHVKKQVTIVTGAQSWWEHWETMWNILWKLRHFSTNFNPQLFEDCLVTSTFCITLFHQCTPNQAPIEPKGSGWKAKRLRRFRLEPGSGPPWWLSR